MELREKPLERSIPLWSIICPYFGDLHHWYRIMSSLSRTSRNTAVKKTSLVLKALKTCKCKMLVSTGGRIRIKHMQSGKYREYKFPSIQGFNEFPYFLFKVRIVDIYFSRFCIDNDPVAVVVFFKNSTLFRKRYSTEVRA